VTGFFQNLYNTLVGNSIVPDMVNGITSWFGVMDQQTTNITSRMMGALTNQFDKGYNVLLAQTASFGDSVTSLTNSITTTMQHSFSQAFTGILSGAVSLGDGMGSVLQALGGTVKRFLVQQLAQSATQSLSAFTSWVAGVLARVASVITAVLQQAYATLVAFFAWSGPAAPALAAGVIAAAVAGIGSLVGQVAKSVKIPGLAQGGIVTGPTLAMVGEGHRREAVIPLERDNVIAESVGQAVFEAMMTAERFRRASGGEAAGAQQEVILRIDGTTFARLILPHMVREGQRQGMDVVIRPATGV